jgi:hypothetical protein
VLLNICVWEHTALSAPPPSSHRTDTMMQQHMIPDSVEMLATYDRIANYRHDVLSHNSRHKWDATHLYALYITPMISTCHFIHTPKWSVTERSRKFRLICLTTCDLPSLVGLNRQGKDNLWTTNCKRRGRSGRGQIQRIIRHSPRGFEGKNKNLQTAGLLPEIRLRMT